MTMSGWKPTISLIHPSIHWIRDAMGKPVAQVLQVLVDDLGKVPWVNLSFGVSPKPMTGTASVPVANIRMSLDLLQCPHLNVYICQNKLSHMGCDNDASTPRLQLLIQYVLIRQYRIGPNTWLKGFLKVDLILIWSWYNVKLAHEIGKWGTQ